MTITLRRSKTYRKQEHESGGDGTNDRHDIVEALRERSYHQGNYEPEGDGSTSEQGIVGEKRALGVARYLDHKRF